MVKVIIAGGGASGCGAALAARAAGAEVLLVEQTELLMTGALRAGRMNTNAKIIAAEESKALELWQEEGLPEFKVNPPLHGVNLGYWSREREEEAALAVQGRHYETGEKFAGQRRVLHPDDPLV